MQVSEIYTLMIAKSREVVFLDITLCDNPPFNPVKSNLGRDKLKPL